MQTKNLIDGILAITLALVMTMGNILAGSTANVLASTTNLHAMLPTIRMGENAPMTREEFMDWREQKGIRHFSIDGRIYPAGIFFNGNHGRAFRYGEITDMILHVYLMPGSVSESRELTAQEPANVPGPETSPSPGQIPASPVTFDNLTAVLFSDEELTALIEGTPHTGPLETRSTINLPNRRLTETELKAWIADYNDVGGASAFEIGVVREINRVRVRYGLHPLALCPALMMSARFKVQEFGDLQYFGHISPVYGSPALSSQMFGVTGFANETLTQSGSNGAPALLSTPESIVNGMLASTRGHREILLNPRLSSVGFGAFFSPNSRGASGNTTHMFYFATHFGVIHDIASTGGTEIFHSGLPVFLGYMPSQNIQEI